jgi:RimJ/RimL family protein N-acetyltransferase
MICGEIQTERLVLRRFTCEDLDDLCRIFAKQEVVRYIGNGKPTDRDQTTLALDSILKHYKRHGYGRLAVILKETEELIGYGGLRDLFGVPELVYLLDNAWWHRGLATEIGRACLEHGFNELQVDRIVAMTMPENIPSRRVLEKLGMDLEGVRSYYGCDVTFYSISESAHLLNTRACAAFSPSDQLKFCDPRPGVTLSC